MGILNVTPDSFSDGGQLATLDCAVQHARRMVADGADIIDVGGQSTRPGAERLSDAQEAERVVPVIRWRPQHEDRERARADQPLQASCMLQAACILDPHSLRQGSPVGRGVASFATLRQHINSVIALHPYMHVHQLLQG